MRLLQRLAEELWAEVPACSSARSQRSAASAVFLLHDLHKGLSSAKTEQVSASEALELAAAGRPSGRLSAAELAVRRVRIYSAQLHRLHAHLLVLYGLHVRCSGGFTRDSASGASQQWIRSVAGQVCRLRAQGVELL